jgi:histidinol dehydrogenase
MSTMPARSRFVLPIAQPISSLTANDRMKLLNRGRAQDPDVARQVAAIVEGVRRNGDAELHQLALRFDGVALSALEVPRARWVEALEAMDPTVRSALEQAADAIRAFHAAQLPQPLEIEVQRGVRLGRRAEALRSVAVYAPGGRAAYPSSVLMGVVPARVAGVREIIVASPPGPDGLPPAVVRAACALAGADRLFAIGGAGAIAALALGTRSVPRVDKIVGPGNAYVTEAKLQLTGEVAIDGPAGPSEILVLADASADPEVIALELLAQAEHDPDAAAVLACTDAGLIAATVEVIERRLEDSPRREIVEVALAGQGALLLAADEDELVRFATEYAPEHLLLLTRAPRSTLERVRNAGTVFLGGASSVAFGDYTSGANHVLPTAGRARNQSGLSTADFLRWFTFQEITDSAAATLSAPTVTLAEAEGLPAHAEAARYRRRAEMGDFAEPLLRSAYRDIALYDPQRAPCEIDLSDNTNLFGVPPSVERLFGSLPAARLTRYPSVFAAALKEEIARWFGVSAENVATGCGSDDVIDSAIRAFCERGDSVVFPDPTFSVVATFARMNAAVPVAVPLTSALELDVDRLLQSRGRVTYVCRPNNPTGTVFAAADVQALADQLPGVLLLDEAYADFAQRGFTQQAVTMDRVISLRTFSKAFGLAGLRLGFAIGPARLIHEIEKSRGPYKVSNVAEAAALAALTQDGDWIRAAISQVCQNRERLYHDLQQRGFRCWPSGGNFLLVGVPTNSSAAKLAAGLRSRGIAVRPFAGLPQLGDCIRVTIGPWPLMERFLTELVAA